MNKKTFFVLFLILILVAPVAFAVGNLKGLTILKIKAKHINVELEQAVIINGDQAIFQGLDDLGGDVFTAVLGEQNIDFLVQGRLIKSKNNSLQKVLSLPLTRTEFLSILRHEKPATFEESCPCEGEQYWKPMDKRKMKVTYSDPAWIGGTKEYFLKHVRIENDDYYFDLTWKNVSIK